MPNALSLHNISNTLPDSPEPWDPTFCYVVKCCIFAFYKNRSSQNVKKNIWLAF